MRKSNQSEFKQEDVQLRHVQSHRTHSECRPAFAGKSRAGFAFVCVCAEIYRCCASDDTAATSSLSIPSVARGGDGGSVWAEVR